MLGFYEKIEDLKISWQDPEISSLLDNIELDPSIIWYDYILFY